MIIDMSNSEARLRELGLETAPHGAYRHGRRYSVLFRAIQNGDLPAYTVPAGKGKRPLYLVRPSDVDKLLGEIADLPVPKELVVA